MYTKKYIPKKYILVWLFKSIIHKCSHNYLCTFGIVMLGMLSLHSLRKWEQEIRLSSFSAYVWYTDSLVRHDGRLIFREFGSLSQTLPAKFCYQEIADRAAFPILPFAFPGPMWKTLLPSRKKIHKCMHKYDSMSV